jgi:hypothetical protein
LGNKLAVWVAGVVERAATGMAELAEREGVQIEHLTLALRAGEALATLRRQQGQAEVLGLLTAEDRLDNEDLPSIVPRCSPVTSGQPNGLRIGVRFVNATHEHQRRQQNCLYANGFRAKLR